MSIKDNALKGKDTNIILANETHKGYYLICELAEVQASHNENNFASNPKFPHVNGYNINDRNYANDKAAQDLVAKYALGLMPELLITNAKTVEGTPIIDAHGIVVSGNNRVMSIKLAQKLYPQNYQNYVKLLEEEISVFFDNRDVSSNILDRLKKIKQPILVRVDLDFASYTTEQLAKYNVGQQKTKRSIDKTVELGVILQEKKLCATTIASLIGSYDTMTDFYTSYSAQKKMLQYLQECGLLAQHEIPAYYTTETGFSTQGKDLVEMSILSLILNRDMLTIAEKEGIKTLRNKLVSMIPLLMQTKTLTKGYSFIEGINEALLIEHNLRILAGASQTEEANYANFKNFLANTPDFFDADVQHYTRNGLVLNRILTSVPTSKIKERIRRYNESSNTESSGNSLFGEPQTPKQLFQTYFENLLEEKYLTVIEKYLSRYNSPAQPKPSDLLEVKNLAILRDKSYLRIWGHLKHKWAKEIRAFENADKKLVKPKQLYLGLHFCMDKKSYLWWREENTEAFKKYEFLVLEPYVLFQEIWENKKGELIVVWVYTAERKML